MVSKNLIFRLVSVSFTCILGIVSCEYGEYDPALGPPPTLVLTNCAIIEGTGRETIQNKSIIIHDDIITDITSSPTDVYPRSTRIINLKGAFVLPGIINSHVHHGREVTNLRTWAKAGVTTVRDVGDGGSSNGLFRSRDKLKSDNKIAGLVAAGPLITTTGGYGQLKVRDTQDARLQVNRLINEGADIIKIAIEDNLQGRNWAIIPDPVIRVITSVAHERNRWVSAHVSRSKHVQKAIDGQVDGLEHMIINYLPAHLIETLVEKNMYWVPTLELWHGVDNLYNIHWLDIAIDNLRRYAEAGGMVALGTDFGGYDTPFDSGMPITEMKLMQEAGMTNMEIIQAGTLNAAVVCGRGELLGTIEINKIADLIVSKHDPLTNIEALSDLKMVIKNGEIILSN